MFTRSSWDRTLDHMRYLYSEKSGAVGAGIVLLVPAGALTFALLEVGYQAAAPRLGPLIGGALSAVMVALGVIAVVEAAPLLPIQVIENKLRYKIAAGWVYLALVLTMGWFFFIQLTEMWHKEFAGQIAWMPELLAIIGIGGVVVMGLMVSVHRLPLTIHNRIMEYEQSAEFSQDYEILQRAYMAWMIQLGRRVQEQRALESVEVERWMPIVSATKSQLDKLERRIISNLTEGL